MAFDPNDPDTKAALKALVDEALEPVLAKRDELLGEVRKLKKGQQVDPADVQRLEDERDAQKQRADKAEKDAKTAAAAAAKATEDLGKAQGSMQKLLVDNGLNSALAKHGVTNPVHQKAVKAMLAGQVEIADGVAKVGDKSLEDYVSEWSKGDEGKFFVAAPGNGGGGAHGGGGAGNGTDYSKIADPGARIQAARAAGLKQ